ncbi:superoxide dismutase, Ni [Alteromonas sp. D210916BOD_24]|uniref:superoxide dismutase, Ni n=1 Tax=Alteromonas sp. D210916BOD_24 TaxID=3157618 RepID=UPI00399D390C
MIHRLLSKIDARRPFNTASAHCDIPCKIYDPFSAQLAALSVIRFVDLLDEIAAKDTHTFADQAQISRLIGEKETHAEKVKQEVRVIWGDYFKAPQFEKFPDTHELVHKIMLAGSGCKQHVSREKAMELLTLVNEFAERFWATKDVATKKATCPYPPAEEVVYPAL